MRERLSSRILRPLVVVQFEPESVKSARKQKNSPGGWVLSRRQAKDNKLPPADVPYAALDPEIVPLVRRLNEGGFPTICSCQGGDGHAFKHPTIQVRRLGDLDATRKALCALLLKIGTEGFSVKTVSMHQKSAAPEPYSYVEVELWR
jgi:hypothetical protein